MSDADITIPTVDLDDVDSPDDEQQQRAARAIREGLGTCGLVFVRNHGVDPSTLATLYDEFLHWTERPEAEKRALCRPDLWFQRGWTPPNTEQAVVSSSQPDFKECYFAAPFPSDTEMKLQFPQLHADNVWPEGGAGLRDRYLDVGRQLHRAGLRLLRGCSMALRLGADELTGVVAGGPHVFRLLRYLPLSSAQVGQNVVWGEEHTDFNLLTLLPGGSFYSADGARSAAPDDESGLFSRTRPTAEHPHGRMVPSIAPDGCILAQVGQALEILTGGAFLATPHVVTAPNAPGLSRLSAAHFMHVDSHAMLFPLPAFRTERAIVDYSPPVLAGNYAIKTLVDIKLAPPEAIDRLGYRHYDRLFSQRAAEKRDRQVG